MTNCTADVTGDLTAEGEEGNVGGLVGRVLSDATLTSCTANVTGDLGGQYVGGLVGGVKWDAALTDCAAQTVITKQGDGSCAPSGPVGEGAELVTFEGANVTTLRMGADSDVFLALMNGTALTLTDGPTATGEAEGSGTTGSVTVRHDGSAEIQVHGGDATYTLTGVNGTIWLEDKTGDAPAEYWVTLDAGFTSTGPIPWPEGNSVNLLGEAGNRPCTVTVQAGTGGSVTGGGTFDAGTKVTVTAMPDSGYRFVNWTENGQAVSAEASYV